jgi:phosphonate transport system substrate-binding protein
MSGRASNKFKFSLQSLGLVLLVLTGACTKKPDSTSHELTIGVLPNEGSKDLDLFRNELSKRIGMPVKVAVPKDYSDLLSKFSKGEIDFAFFTALLFIQAEREAQAKALLKKVYGTSDFYYSAVVVRADSSIKNLKDLEGKRFGFVDPKSTSGYLFPRVLLRSVGLDAGDGVAAGAKTLSHEFLGTHENSVQALLDKRVDAIGVWAEEPGTNKGAWNSAQFEKLNAKTFRVLSLSDPIPNDAFAVREAFYSQSSAVVLKVMEALIAMDEGEVLKKVFNVDKMATATSRHYDSVRPLEDLVKEKAQ